VPTSLDVEIGPDDLLYHRLAPGNAHIKRDGSVASNAYKLNSQPDLEPSVDLAKLTTPAESVNRAPSAGFKLGVLRVGDIKALGFEIVPKPTDDNPAHCIIEGNRSKDTCSRLADNTKVLPGIIST
jgi:hypothetical protein